MSPEQRTAQSVTGATDQYAFGVMAFEVLTGDLPFKGTFMEVLAAHLTEPPPSLRERRPEVPPSIEALVHRMMAKSPADRFPSLREAERAFRALVPDEGATTQVIASYSHVKAAAGSAKFAAPDAAAPAASATIADARKIGRDFVTMLNQRRYRERAQLPAKGGDAASRAELIGLVQNARDFAAGLERIASVPDRTSDGFMTDFVLDLEWQGGRKLMVVTAIDTMQAGNWRLAGFGVEAAH